MHDTLCEVFGITNDESAQLMSALAAFFQLPDQIESRLRQNPDLDHPLYLEWRPSVTTFFAHCLAFNEQLATAQAMYSDATLLGLRHAAAVLPHEGPLIPPGDLAKLLEMLADLEKCISEETSGELSLFLFDLVNEMRTAVHQVRIRGVEGLEDSLERALGALQLRRARNQPQPAPDGSFWKKFGVLIAGMTAVVGLGNGLYALEQNMLKLLELGP